MSISPLVSYSLIASILVALCVYWAIPRRWRPAFLLAGSYLFYCLWDVKYVWILGCTTLLDYVMARAIVSRPAGKRVFLGVSIFANVAVLAYFKYARAAVQEYFTLFPHLPDLLTPHMPLAMAAPLGISFYTFHSISYITDVYRGQIAPMTSLRAYALYVSYFPKILSGPVERAESFMESIRQLPERLDLDKLRGGVSLLIYGLFLKMVISQNLHLMQSYAFSSAANASQGELLAGFYSNSLNIYSDFFSYTLIARGISRLFGIELERNFNRPYLAHSVRDFWHRWHISLSTWFRDYVYFPLGGNRNHYVRNILITFFLAGLWHGSAATFVVWGLYNGVWYLLEGFAERGLSRIPRALRIFATFHITSIGWVFFRASDLGSALLYLKRLLGTSGFWGQYTLPMTGWLFCLAGAWCAISLLPNPDRPGPPRLLFQGVSTFGAGLMLLCIVIFGADHVTPFLYLRF